VEKVEAYVRKNYSKMFGDKELIIEEFDSHFTVKAHKDESPLILGKNIG
jgi:hypothetical protein